MINMINIAHILPTALNHDFVKKKKKISLRKKRFLCDRNQ